MSIADKLATIAENEQRVYDAGYAAGETEGIEIGEAKHISRYATGTIQGNNKTTLTIPCPFKPDAVILQHYHPLYAVTNTNSVVLWQADFRAFAVQIGMLKYKKGNSNSYAHIAADTIKGYVAYKDGAITFSIPSSLTGVTHKDWALYNYACVRYTDKDDYTLLVEQIEKLPLDGGTIQYSQSRVQETIEEAIAKGAIVDYASWEDVWEEVLIKKQPKWTFSFG